MVNNDRTHSGMKPNLTKSSGSTSSSISFSFLANSCPRSPLCSPPPLAILAVKPMLPFSILLVMSFSNPTNAPERMKRMLVVSTR